MSPSPSDDLTRRQQQEVPPQFKSLIENIQRWAGSLATVGFCLKSEPRLDGSIGRSKRPKSNPVEHTLEITATITQLGRRRLLTRLIGGAREKTQIILESPTLVEDLSHTYGDARVICQGARNNANSMLFDLNSRHGKMMLAIPLAFFQSAILGAFAGQNGIASLASQVREDLSARLPSPDISGGLTDTRLQDIALGLVIPSASSPYFPQDATRHDLTLTLYMPPKIGAGCIRAYKPGPDGHFKVAAEGVRNKRIKAFIDLNYRTGEIAVSSAEDSRSMRVVEIVKRLTDAKIWINGFLSGFAAGSALK